MVPLFGEILEAHEYRITVSRQSGLVCLMIGVVIVALLAIVVFVLMRRRK